MKLLCISAALAATAALAGCATAPPPAVVAADGRVCTTGSIDANGDGAVTAAEWNAWHGTGFGSWDTDGDGRIERDEFQACYMAGGFYPASVHDPAHWTHYWSAFDVNGDGYLSQDEYWSTQAWARIDANRNGIIDASEWAWWSM